MTTEYLRYIRSFLCVVCVGSALSLAGAAAVAGDAAGNGSTDLGSVEFANSGAAEAQPAFLTGMKALHSFEFATAGEAFREAQAIDPDFALAYWGEALSYNFPLWAAQDRKAALAALARYAPTPEARAERLPPGRERSFMEAADVLYGSGDKLPRDIAYSEALRRLHDAHPDDDEIATLYALSLLGTVRRSDKGFGRQARAGAIAMEVFARSPDHPGAAHYIIHAFDDPEHAILALPAAKAYARIAPAAPHGRRTYSSSSGCGTRWWHPTTSPTEPRSIISSARASRAAGRMPIRCSGCTTAFSSSAKRSGRNGCSTRRCGRWRRSRPRGCAMA